MKILFFAPQFYPHIGGVEKHVLEISKRLVEKRSKVTIITEQVDNAFQSIKAPYHSKFNSANEAKKTKQAVKSAQINRKKIENFDVYYLRFGKPGFFKKFRIWWQLFKLRDLIKNADIVHCHDVFFWYLPFRFLYPTKPVYTTFHGYETNFPPSKKAIFIRKVSEQLSNGTICVGGYIKKWYGAKPDYVVYGGVNEI